MVNRTPKPAGKKRRLKPRPDAEKAALAMASENVANLTSVKRTKGAKATALLDRSQFNPLVVIDPDATPIHPDAVPLAKKPETDYEWLQQAAARGIRELGGQGFVNEALNQDKQSGLRLAKDILKDDTGAAQTQVTLGIKVVQGIDLDRI